VVFSWDTKWAARLLPEKFVFLVVGIVVLLFVVAAG
jgi:hypothetical protein